VASGRVHLAVDEFRKLLIAERRADRARIELEKRMSDFRDTDLDDYVEITTELTERFEANDKSHRNT
jgi:hypothetical protein